MAPSSPRSSSLAHAAQSGDLAQTGSFRCVRRRTAESRSHRQARGPSTAVHCPDGSAAHALRTEFGACITCDRVGSADSFTVINALGPAPVTRADLMVAGGAMGDVLKTTDLAAFGTKRPILFADKMTAC